MWTKDQTWPRERMEEVARKSCARRGKEFDRIGDVDGAGYFWVHCKDGSRFTIWMW